MSVRGIDVSDYQSGVDWRVVANSGIAFAFVKATEGGTFVAKTFSKNWQELKANGIIRGAYHFFRCARDPQVQAELFLKTVKLEPGDLPPVLDIESTDGVDNVTIRSRITKWLEIIEKETGVVPIIYTYPGFWNTLGTTGFTDHPLWIAHYTTASEPWIPGGWTGWAFWQYTDSGKVSGAPGNIDVNIFQSVQSGMKGSTITQVQKTLQKKGFDVGTPDGSYGPKTQTAVTAFQKSKGLTTDGITGLKTWTALMGKPLPNVATPSPSPVVIKPSPTPSPVPVPVPPLVVDPLAIVPLVEVCNTYRGLPYQEEAVNWLQSQISSLTLANFTQRWRNPQSANNTPTIRLIDVCKSYRELPHQQKAIQWLQGQLPQSVITTFAQRWREPNSTSTGPIQLTDVCKYYQNLTRQNQAIEWLQQQIPPNVLNGFTQQWRNPA